MSDPKTKVLLYFSTFAGPSSITEERGKRNRIDRDKFQGRSREEEKIPGKKRFVLEINELIRDRSQLATTAQTVIRNGLHGYQCYCSHMTRKK